MVEEGTEEQTGSTAEQPLDPFGLVPDWRSKVAGLGGASEPGDLNYVLHTVYVPVAEGYSHFRMRFHELTGKFGTLVVRVHMYQKGSNDARLVSSERILLSRLVQLGGDHRIRFEAFHGVMYALVASLEGMTDAKAQMVEVTLDRPGHEDAPATATEARNSAYGRDAVRGARSIISVARATLAEPVSQRCTGAQLAEPVFREWSRRLGERPEPTLDRWCEVYVLQVLDRYGMLRDGAVGLGIGAASSSVPALAAAAGTFIEVVDTAPDEAAVLDGLRRNHPNGSSLIPDALRYRTVDVAALPRDLVNFDFLWSERVASRIGDAARGVRLAEATMACLRPGGLAVHVVDFALSAESATEITGIAAWQRRELDRLALILISRGHDIAEIKVDETRAPVLGGGRRATRTGITAAGLIARKAQTIE